jgi:serine/threonine protein kinase/WD40 repeat protein
MFRTYRYSVERLAMFRSGPSLAQATQVMSFRQAARSTGIPHAPLLTAVAGSHDDAASTIVSPAVKSDGTEGLPPTLPTAPLRGDPTPSAHSVAAPTAQSAAAPALFRAPERYQILNEHGRGGLGLVSRAHDRELGRDVAIKELISRTTVSEARFLREAMITARLEHPGIVPMYEAGRWPDGTPYYAMKLVSGRPLRDLIAERTTVDQRIGLLHHVIAVADAIAYAHGRNIIHRDLKPANVIVGDFGETIVIDWGLAKDLSSSGDEPAAAGIPAGPPNDGDLTATGAVVGTPTYMAPEQERGEQVDQRADVFAIGAMLWELCSLQKVPPTNLRQRHRLLRRARIDQDLAVIIDKTLDPDPTQRYPDAAALAADLKAFKAGARIAARKYSTWARLAHWIRRNRTLSSSAGIAVVLALVGSVLYVHNIAAERGRALNSEQAAERAQRSAEASLDALTLKHAELLLSADPTAAIDSLETYNGADPRASQLRADARGRGIAQLRATPHTDAIHWIHGNPDGSIVSFSVDGTISRTSPDGSSVVLASDVVHRGVYSYSARRQLFVYACDPADLCMLDLLHYRHYLLARSTDGVQLDGVDFSPDGTEVASITQTGELRIFDITNPDKPIERIHISTGNGVAILFIASGILAVGTDGGLQLIHVNGKTQTFLDPDGSYWDVDTKQRRLAFATTRGEGLLAKTDDLRIAERATLCRDEIAGVKFVPGREIIAFICREGTVGTWDLESGKVSPYAHVEGHAHMLEVSESGEYLITSSDNGVLTAVNLVTSLVTSFRGHGVRLVAISAPTSGFPFFLSGDVRGRIRAWAVPATFTRVVARTQSRYRSAIYNVAANVTIAIPLAPRLDVLSPSTGLQSITPHDENATFVEFSGDGSRFTTYGASDSVEIWLSGAMSRTHLLNTHHGSVTHSAFDANASDLVTSGRDGRLLRWTPAGEYSLIADFNQSITGFVLAAKTRSTVVATTDGALWRLAQDGRIVSLRDRGIQVTKLLVLSDGVTVCIGYSNGEVVTVDTTSWQQTLLMRASDGIRDIAFTDDNVVAIASNDDVVHLGVRHGAAWAKAGIAWIALSARARTIAFTADRMLVAACAGGAVWIYSLARDKWLALSIETVDLTLVVLTSDGTSAIIIDDEGRLMSIDLKDVRKALET